MKMKSNFPKKSIAESYQLQCYKNDNSNYEKKNLSQKLIKFLS